MQKEKEKVRQVITAAALQEILEKIKLLLEEGLDSAEPGRTQTEELLQLRQFLSRYQQELRSLEDERIGGFSKELITSIGSIQFSLWPGNVSELWGVLGEEL